MQHTNVRTHSQITRMFDTLLFVLRPSPPRFFISSSPSYNNIIYIIIIVIIFFRVPIVIVILRLVYLSLFVKRRRGLDDDYGSSAVCAKNVNVFPAIMYHRRHIFYTQRVYMYTNNNSWATSCSEQIVLRFYARNTHTHASASIR